MNITHISHSDLAGGASRAAFRLHRAMSNAGQSSNMLVQKKISDDNCVIGPNSYSGKIIPLIRIFIGEMLAKLQRTTHPVQLTPSRLSMGTNRLINSLSADVIHLHFLRDIPSIAEIGRIRKPVVWTLHDMWAFCGAEHYTTDKIQARWRKGYCRENLQPDHKGVDVNRWTWTHKKQAWQRPFHLVTPGKWLADCVQNSALMKNWPCSVIPYSLDIELFKPLDKKQGRYVLNLPQDKKLILFGAIGGGDDPRKGFDLLQAALLRLALVEKDKYQCVIFGQSQPVNPPDLGLPTTWMGHLNDEWSLALLYSAADIMVVASRQDNLPQTGTEAQACGCPVVAFDTAGLPDVLVHRETGYLARPFEPEDLAHGISWILRDKERYEKLCGKARERAVSLWAPDIVVPQYLDVYQQAIEQQENRAAK